MNSSPNSSEFRDFFLDRLPPEQAEAIEERMFQDEAYFSELQDAEDELIEEYVTEEMDPAEAQLFNARVDRDSELRERVTIRRALIGCLQSTPAAAAQPTGLRLRHRIWGRLLIPAFALAILMVFFLSYRAEHRAMLPSQAMGAPSGSVAKQGSNRQEALSQATAVLFLPAHVARGETQQSSVLHIGSAVSVRLELETPSADGSERWNVRISEGGNDVFRAEGLAVRQAGVVSYVVAEVRSSQLPPKIYQITLSPQASSNGAVGSSWDLQVVR